MKKVVLLFVLALSVVSSGLSNNVTPLNDTVPSPGYVIEKALEALKGIHTVSYNLEMREYLTPEDSAFVNKSTFRYIECENKGDSTGLSKFICFNKDGEFRDSYDGMFSLRLGDGYISKTDISRQSVVSISSPFYNYVTRLCEYHSGEIKAYESFLKKYNIEFPVALNNGRFYSVFSKIGLAPIFIVIDRDDRIVLYGYDTNLYNIIEDGIKGCLNAVSS